MTTPTPGAPQEAPPAPGQSQGNGLAIAGLAVGLIALFLSWAPILGLALGILGLVLAILGMKASNERAGAGKGPAIAGIVLSILAILVGGLSTACGFACGSAMRTAGVHMERQQELLNERAVEEGYPDFDAWMDAEPQAAAEAQAEVAAETGRRVLEEWGVDMEDLEEGDEADEAGPPPQGPADPDQPAQPPEPAQQVPSDLPDDAQEAAP